MFLGIRGIMAINGFLNELTALKHSAHERAVDAAYCRMLFVSLSRLWIVPIISSPEFGPQRDTRGAGNGPRRFQNRKFKTVGNGT
jgi:hypothetical protein